jgi:hypothetical protein
MTPRSKYYHLAKFGLQASSIVLAFMTTLSITGLITSGDTKYFPFIISSAQGLSCIALGVMSYHLGLNK